MGQDDLDTLIKQTDNPVLGQMSHGSREIAFNGGIKLLRHISIFIGEQAGLLDQTNHQVTKILGRRMQLLTQVSVLPTIPSYNN